MTLLEPKKVLAERKVEREQLIRQLVAGSLEIIYHRAQDDKVYCTLSTTARKAVAGSPPEEKRQ